MNNHRQTMDEPEGDGFCVHGPGDSQDLGKATSLPVVLVKAPVGQSIPALEILTGATIVVGSFYLVHNEHFWALALMVVGFVLLFIGINRLKLQDLRKRVVQLFQNGFTYKVGRQTVEISFRDIKSAKLNSQDVELKGVTIGVLHKLHVSCGEKQIHISSFEHEMGQGPKETDKFVLWAKKLLAAYKTRR